MRLSNSDVAELFFCVGIVNNSQKNYVKLLRINKIV